MKAGRKKKPKIRKSYIIVCDGKELRRQYKVLGAAKNKLVQLRQSYPSYKYYIQEYLLTPTDKYLVTNVAELVMKDDVSELIYE